MKNSAVIVWAALLILVGLAGAVGFFTFCCVSAICISLKLYLLKESLSKEHHTSYESVW